MSAIAEAIEPHRIPIRRRIAAWGALTILGVPGVVSLLLVIPALLDQAAARDPRIAAVPRALLEAAALGQSFALVAAFALLGLLTSSAAGLRSSLVDRVLGRRGPPSASAIGLPIAAGVVVLAITVIVDQQLAPLYGAGWKAVQAQAPSEAKALVVGILYGGIDEEIIFRWGILSLLAWAGWRIFERHRAAPSGRTMAWAIALSALAFAAGHLPLATAIGHALSPVFFARTVTLNALSGAVFGWLYQRYSLETAMASHATFHVSLFVARQFIDIS